mmetsp:Transcript_3495/g.14442  ORF Transcript_3495/g.14442 Transcript_3495/m.14442 type:complete len:467 (+) Transcript_3495:539-1939(+)
MRASTLLGIPEGAGGSTDSVTSPAWEKVTRAATPRPRWLPAARPASTAVHGSSGSCVASAARLASSAEGPRDTAVAGETRPLLPADARGERASTGKHLGAAARGRGSSSLRTTGEQGLAQSKSPARSEMDGDTTRADWPPRSSSTPVVSSDADATLLWGAADEARGAASPSRRTRIDSAWAADTGCPGGSCRCPLKRGSIAMTATVGPTRSDASRVSSGPACSNDGTSSESPPSHSLAMAPPGPAKAARPARGPGSPVSLRGSWTSPLHSTGTRTADSASELADAACGRLLARPLASDRAAADPSSATPCPATPAPASTSNTSGPASGANTRARTLVAPLELSGPRPATHSSQPQSLPRVAARTGTARLAEAEPPCAHGALAASSTCSHGTLACGTAAASPRPRRCVRQLACARDSHASLRAAPELAMAAGSGQGRSIDLAWRDRTVTASKSPFSSPSCRHVTATA